jgi:sulfatase maturation enzyme AslB (radical SAM superfamily)
MWPPIMTQLSFDHKHVLLTGAGGGPGSALVKLLGRVDRKMASLRDKLNGKKSLKNRPWRLFQVESAIACNLKCVMCPWREIAKKVIDRGIMAPEIWEAIRPYLSRVQSLDFTGGGEPLVAAQRRKIKKDSGCRY